MTCYVTRQSTDVEAVQIPHNTWADHPNEGWAEEPEWLTNAFEIGQIRPRMGGEGFWYYDLYVGDKDFGMAGAPDQWFVRGSDTFISILDSERLNEIYYKVEELGKVPVFLPGVTATTTVGVVTIDSDETLKVTFDGPEVKQQMTEAFSQSSIAISLIHSSPEAEPVSTNEAANVSEETATNE